MQIIRWLKSFSAFEKGTVVTLGNFDGMHQGHQALLRALEALAKEKALPSVLLTFEPQPQEYFSRTPLMPRLMRFREKVEFLKSTQLDYLVPLRFNQALASLSPDAFVRKILCEKLKVCYLVVGDDFRFGSRRAGDVTLLKALGEQYGFEVLCVSDLMDVGERISSTRIREWLALGHIDQANALLGHPYTISGRVVHGNKRGRELGFPTANIPMRRGYSPLMGVFAVMIEGLSKKPMKAVASVGRQPMFGGRSVLLEVFIFDFDEMIYGEFVSVAFYHKLRDQENYPDIVTLIDQMHQDVKQAKAYFSEDGGK